MKHSPGWKKLNNIHEMSTDRQQRSLAVATDGPDWSSVSVYGVLGFQVFEVVLCDLSIQTGAEETLTHPAQSLNRPAILSWDQLCTKSENKSGDYYICTENYLKCIQYDISIISETVYRLTKVFIVTVTDLLCAAYRYI